MSKLIPGARVCGAIALSLLVSRAAPAKEIPGATLRPLGEKIVNGLGTHLDPSVGMLVINDGSLCSGVLVGCQTFLTAAHCVCTLNGVAAFDGAQCNARPDLLDPGRFLLFFQHAGTFRVASVAVNPSYIPATASDLALLRLSAPIEGIAPTPINTVAKPPFGTAGTIVGFGSTQADLEDGGIKRAGTVTTSSCSGPGNAFEICWTFSPPAGQPGTSSNTCRGDSGGPLLVSTASGQVVVAGVASFVNSCLPPATAVDADVFRDRAWIEAQAGSDLTSTACGSLPQAGGPGTSIVSGDSTLSATAPQAGFDFEVPAGTTRLRVSLNGEPGNLAYLYAKAGGPAGPASFDCKSEVSAAPGGFPLEFYEVQSPAPGSWNVLARRVGGPGGRFQTTVTLFSSPAGSACIADASTLCIDDRPGDRRFKVQVSYQTTQGGGRSGTGTAIPLSSLGVDRGGLFWFFSPDNPEMLVKVINACSANGKFWVFYSAGTNVGLTTTVTDTVTGQVKTYSNPDLTPAAPVQDTGALPCR
jgi:hypothetical protein